MVLGDEVAALVVSKYVPYVERIANYTNRNAWVNLEQKKLEKMLARAQSKK